MKKTVLNVSVLVISLLIAVLLAEGMCRMFLNPADYLLVDLVDDPVLDHKVASGTPGYDKWGFRNKKVPEQADIVTIGDSHTYSNNATMEDSWPKVLGRLSGKKVYNMATGSYSPIQYYHLLKNKALKLNPEHVIVGFYMGNDQMGTYRMSYYNENWHHLRDPSLVKKLDRSGKNIIDQYIHKDNARNSDEEFLGDLRGWLSRNSFVYRLTIHGPLLGGLKRKLELMFKSNNNKQFTRLKVASENIDEGFRPVHRANKMDMSNPRIREGLRISLELLNKMKKICEENGIKFTVMLIPSKEFVFANYLSSSPDLKNFDDIKRLLVNEKKMADSARAYFSQHQINYTDPVSQLRAQIGKRKIYPANFDDHPNSYGYTLYAKSAYNKLNDLITESAKKNAK